MSKKLFPSFQNSKKRLLKLFLSAMLTVVIFIAAAIFLVSVDTVRDIYPESISNIDPSKVLEPEIAFSPEINYYGFMIYSSASVSTKSTSSQVSSWYAKKGWDALGSMWQTGKKYRIGMLTLSIFKVVELGTDSSENEADGLSTFGIGESYEICYCDRR
jgi:hypothetical protein